jgi:betaine-aldehyde dehydrogenase
MHLASDAVSMLSLRSDRESRSPASQAALSLKERQFNMSTPAESSKFGPLPMSRRTLYYGGDWHEPLSGEVVDVTNPATGGSLGTVAWAGAADADRAVHAAYDGFLQWRDTTPLQRGAIMRQAAAAIRYHAKEIIQLETADSGVPYKRITPDIEAGALAFEYFGGLITELKGTTIPVGSKNLNYTLREPLGVIVRINAFNHPFLFATQHAAAALAAGNSVITKPAEQTPLSTLYLGEIIGSMFPPGVVSVLPGGRACGEALVAHRKVAKVGLVGSIPTGKAILAAGADTLKKISLELGGKNALIAYPDADLPGVVAGIVKGMNFAFLGQSCGSTSRVFLHAEIHDAVLERVVEIVRAMRFGDPRDADTEMGCLVSQTQLDKVQHYVELARSEGARLVLGGSRPTDQRFAKGFYFEPTIFADVTPQMRIAREEVFGPVLSILRWRTESELFAAVNELDYGLSASIWTTNLATAHRAAARVEAGYVWINGAGTHYYGAPFGGYKQSGLGREESIEELIDNTQIKNINVSL